MKTRWIETENQYDGSQLRSLFAYLKFGLQGDSIVSWVGPCNVTPEHMVDGEDLLAHAKIAGDRMVHFIVEKFGATLAEMVWMQRLLAAIVLDIVVQKGRAKAWREGDDVFVQLANGPGKLSISIATVSPVSGLIHFAVNVVNDGTPVLTSSLEDFRMAARDFSDSVMAAFAAEFESVQLATTKVRWVQ